MPSRMASFYLPVNILYLASYRFRAKESKESGPVKIWDQEMKKCHAFQLGSGSQKLVPRSVSRGGPKVNFLSWFLTDF